MRLKKFEVLSPGEIQNIVEAGERILAQTGVKVESEKALKKLKEKGLPVNTTAGVVTFPVDIQRRCLETAPKEIKVIDRNGNHAFTIGDGGAYYASGHNAVFIDNVVTNEHRPFMLKDVENYTALSHHLAEIDMIGLPASPKDVNQRTSLLYSLETAFRKSTKPVFFSTDLSLINHYALEMTCAVSGNNLKKGAYMISQLSPTSPLFWEKGAVDSIIECAERNFPVAILPEPIAGVTSPYSLAGLLTIHNVEALSGVFITQVVNPGCPVIWASSWTAFDMRRSCALVGSLETSLCKIGGAQVAKYYNLPLHTTAPNSDNHALDEQNSWEKVLSLLCAAASGNDLSVNCGMYACGMTISLEQLVMDAEMAGQIKRLLQGINADREMIAEDLIKSIGYRGNYIMEDHTLNLLHTGEYREPLIAARGNIDTWKEAGGKDAIRMAHDLVTEMLTRDLPELDLETARQLKEIITKCESELK
ncbi:MAG: trimethylamine methyltransferase family protein [Spirochaetota bacterium]